MGFLFKKYGQILANPLFILKTPCLHLQTVQQDVLDLATLTAYVGYARKHIHPQLSDEAAEELTRGYVELRRRGNFPGSSKKVECCMHLPTYSLHLILVIIKIMLLPCTLVTNTSF